MPKQLKREELTKEMVQQALKCKDADESFSRWQRAKAMR